MNEAIYSLANEIKDSEQAYYGRLSSLHNNENLRSVVKEVRVYRARHANLYYTNKGFSVARKMTRIGIDGFHNVDVFDTCKEQDGKLFAHGEPLLESFPKSQPKKIEKKVQRKLERILRRLE